MNRTVSRFMAAVLAFLVPVTPLLADRTEWSETATLKTKRIFDDGGNLVYEENFNKASGVRVGPIFDERPAHAPSTAADRSPDAPPADPEVAYTQEGERIFLREDSIIKVRLLDSLDSRTTKRGDTFRYVVLTDVVCRDRKIIREGTTGTGKVLDVRRRGNWGRSGRVTCGFNFVSTVNGTRVRLAMTKRARERNEAEGYAAGASLIGLMALGPLGLVGGAFVKGRDVTIPTDSVFYLGVEENVDVTGEATR
jgi:hypothetical protein